MPGFLGPAGAPDRVYAAPRRGRSPSETKPGAFGRQLATVALVGLAAAVPLAGLELTARVLTHFDIVDSWKPIWIVWTPGTEDYRLAHLTLDDYFQPDPLLIWKPWSSPPYNAQRFKGPLMAVPKPAGVFGIMLYGDSNTDGPDTGGWPEHLQHTLEGRAARGSLRYEVVKAGVAGYSSHQGLLRFRQEVGTYQPDLVTVSFGWNDAGRSRCGPSGPRVSALRRACSRLACAPQGRACTSS